MPAILTSTGIQFSNNTVLNSRRDIYPLGTAWIVYQTSAPTGWTKVTTHNDKALRVVGPGVGGGSGGAIAFTSAFPNSTKPISAPVSGSNGVNGHAVSIPQIASHNHGNGGSIGLNGVPAAYNPDGAFIGWNGGDVRRWPNPSAGANRTWSRTGPNSGPDGSGATHAHPFSGTGTFSTSIDLRVQYIDAIICTFNG